MPIALRPMQTSFAAGELSPALHARIDLAKYHVGAKRLTNYFVHPHGGASNRPGTHFVIEALGKTRLIPFQFNVVQAYMLEFSHLKMRIIRDGGIVVYPAGHEHEGEVVTIDSPYSEGDLEEIKFVQSADTIFLTHPEHAPTTLTRTAHHEWTFSEMSFEPGIEPPEGLAGNYSGSGSFPIKYVVSAVSPDGEESLPSDEVSIDAKTAGDWESGQVVNLSWDAHAGAEFYNVYKNVRGYYGWVGRADSESFTDDNISPDVSDGPQAARNPFEGGNHPGCAGIFEQRLVFGRTNDQPQTAWASQTAHLNNFSTSRPLKDTDAIEATLAALQVNEIKYFIPFSELLIFTSGGEWIMTSGPNSDALTPTSVQFKPQGYRGCGNVRPLVIGDSVLFVQRGGDVVRDMQYKLETDKYTGSNMTVLAEHLFRGRQVTAWAYQQKPDSLVWAALDNGRLLSFTYLPEHEVWAWCPHETKGVFEDVGVIAGEDEDETYFVVKREIDGVEKRFIEKLDSRSFETVQDAFFVDCGLSYNGEAVSTLSGLEHLAGEEVAILADGNVQPAQKVSEAGSISLDHPSSKVHVGLPYASTMETLNVDFSGDRGTAQGLKKAISSVVVRLERTRALWIGPDEDRLVEMPFRVDEGYDEATKLFTGDKEIKIKPSWDRGGRLVIRQTDPLPITVLALIPEVSVSRS